MRALRAEWTKFRTVPGWTIATAAAGLMIVLVAVLAGISSDQRDAPPVPSGPGGGPVTDAFYLLHRTLTGDGSVTVAVSSLTSAVPAAPGRLRPGMIPWAKAGIIIKASDRPGSPYAAIMLTGGHGVRMQHDYVHDRAAPDARWLRLDRSGDAITGRVSADGAHWTTVATVHLEGLGRTVLGGPFVASPPAVSGLGTTGSVSTATFDGLRADGGWSPQAWTGGQIGAETPGFAGYPDGSSGSSSANGDRLTVTGAGDIAPAVRDSLPTGGTHADLLTGALPALITVIVVGALSVTGEHRRNLIHLTLAADPGRTRTLAAKALVLSGVTFTTGLAGAAAAIPLGERLARAHGVYLFPVTAATEVRLVLGTAALLATVAVLALALGTILRGGGAAVTACLAALVLPHLLIANPFTPADIANRLARLTPAAAFAAEQTLTRYPQVTSVYTPYNGYYPLPPWGGIAVLAGYTALALAVAAVLLRRRDA